MRIKRKIFLIQLLILLILITGCTPDKIVTLNFDSTVEESSGTISKITVKIHNYGEDLITDLSLVHSDVDYELTDHSEFTLIYQKTNINVGKNSDVDVIITKDDLNEYVLSNTVKLVNFEGYIGVILHMEAFIQDDTEGKTGFIHSDDRYQFYIICYDTNESNDTSAAAVSLPDYPLGNSIFPGSDSDWFYFEAIGSQTYNISTDYLITFYPSDTSIELYDDPAAVPIESSSNGVGFDSISGWTAPSTGTYYLKITDENSEIGTYHLIVE